ncbi:dynamin family protein [Gordonia amicalis]|uniref:dynamin family protein n=1 Tax=Gordonia amicalis TaxID=89053 RepID=UPI003A7FE401
MERAVNATVVPTSGDAAAVVADAVKVLRAYKKNAVADLAEAKLHRDPQRIVVVAGEVQRGKSSLVNALVGRRDLCPVGVDVTSSVAVSVTTSDSLEAGQTAELFFATEPRPIPVDELADWVTTDGRMVCDRTVEQLPTSAAIGVRESRLPDVTLIDTPGVGGLDPGLAQLASESTQQACVLVLVCDASAPITAPEMEFVREASATVDALVLAVTKTDKHLGRWRQIIEENARLISHHLGREVPVIGVSSLLAVIAADTTDPQLQHRLEVDSGITALREAITTRLEATAAAPHVDAVRTCIEALRVVRGGIADELAALQAGERALPDLTAERDRLTELQAQSRQWEQYLARDLTLLRQGAVDDLERRLDEIRDKWTAYINKNGMEVLRRREQKFTANMQADLQMAMAETLSGFLQQLHDTVIAPRFADDPSVWTEVSNRIVESMQDKKIETHQVASKTQGLLDPTLLTMGVVGSSTLGGILGLSALLGVGVVVGTVWVGVNLGFRAIRAGKTNLLSWLRETLAATKSATGRLLDSAVAQARPEIVIRYRDHLRASIDHLQTTITQVQESAAADAAAREKNVARLTTNLSIVDKRITAAETLLTGPTA